MEEVNGSNYGEYSNDFPIEQLDESHYVFRRGSTQVHIQTFDVSTTNDDIPEGGTLKDDLITLLSGLFGMLIIVITLVIKASAAATDHITEDVVNQYMILLYVLCLLFTIYYNFMAGFFTKDILKFAKSSKSTNRWLKGVIIIFGMAIIFKDGIDILAYIVSGNHNCTENHIIAAMSGFHLVFVMSQTFFLLKYSKVFIQDRSFAPRLGLMFLIATNLSTWIVSVVSETIHALHVKDGHLLETHVTPIGHSAHQNLPKTFEENHTSSLQENMVQQAGVFQVLLPEENIDQSCTCTAQICVMMHAVEKFLFPFLIEFSLVASCLLYITWSNVLKRPPPCEGVIRPSHKLYKSYSGLGLGCFTIFIAMVVMIILGTSGLESFSGHLPTFWNTLNIYNCFLIALELSMLAACYLGFYLFLKIVRPLTQGHSDILDISLLLICILGPLILNTFSMLAVIAGPDNKDDGDWVLSLLCPMCDTLQCVCQAIFVLFGLKREPETSMRSKETIKQVKLRFETVFNERVNRNVAEQKSNDESDSEEFASNFPNKFIRSRQNSVTSVISAIACAPQTKPPPQHYDQYLANNVKSQPKTLENHEQEFQMKLNALHNSKMTKRNLRNGKIPKIILTDETENSTPLLEFAKEDLISLGSIASTDSIGAASDLVEKTHQAAQTVIKIVSKSHLARPNRQRIILRNVVMYLLLSNATLWMFMSLDGTAFSVHFYQSNFYGASVWTTILMICRPLSIFFRMHSAGCLFEIWSYA